ncbi:MAG TPA: MoxR family ATPase [Candidatus Nanoarchaeia archaeon]|nr:MoxR family ATPase [Candidatus Nanoarchaeia archaeon]
MKSYEKGFERLFAEIDKVVIGQDEVIRQMMVAILCDANALLEGYPGLAKTLAVRTVAKLMDLKFSRIQNTPDLMPSDITGTYIIEERGGKREFRFQPGPVFCNILLADEINRATPKTQSALLEAMQERQVTVGNETFKLDRPFFVLATQNPIEQEGTYPLPEAQADRFLLKVITGYPSFEDEVRIVDQYSLSSAPPELPVLLNKKTLFALQALVRQVPLANDLKQRIVRIVTSTRRREGTMFEYGASPRASIGLVLACKARALMEGRNYVSTKDIETMVFPVLRHRVILNFEAQRKGLTQDDAIRDVIAKVKQ